MEANVNATEANNVDVVRKYFAGCQSGDLDIISSTLDADVVHYFLPSRFPPIKGAGPLAKYWRAYKLALNPVWSVDHLIARDDEVVSEWSCIWTPRRTDQRLMLRGSEWYVMRAGKIAEIRPTSCQPMTRTVSSPAFLMASAATSAWRPIWRRRPPRFGAPARTAAGAMSQCQCGWRH